MNDNENSRKTNFKIYTKGVYDKKFDELKKLRKVLHPNEIINASRELFNFPMVSGIVLGNEELSSFPIYRARAIERGKTIDENDLAQFSYSPKPNRLRCNIKGQQVLYAASDPNTAIYEIKKQIIPHKTVVYISSWGIKESAIEPCMHMIFHGLPEYGDSPSSIFAEACKREWETMIKSLPEEPAENLHYYLKAFQEVFTHPTPRYYHLSSAYIYGIFEKLDGKQSVSGVSASMPIVAYPSVAKNKVTANFVFKKEFVDEHFYLKHVEKVIVTKLKDGNVTYKPVSKGILINGKIVWSHYQIKVNSGDYDWAFISANDKLGENLMKVSINEPILLDQKKRQISINQYLSKKGVSYRTLIDGIRQMPQEDEVDVLLEPLKNETMSFLSVEEELYWNKNKIKQIGFPFWYKIGYQN